MGKTSTSKGKRTHTSGGSSTSSPELQSQKKQRTLDSFVESAKNIEDQEDQDEAISPEFGQTTMLAAVHGINTAIISMKTAVEDILYEFNKSVSKRIDTLSETSCDLKTSDNFLSDEITDLKREVKALKDEMKSQSKITDEYKRKLAERDTEYKQKLVERDTEIHDLRKRVKILEESATETQRRSMANNIIVHGIEETTGESVEEKIRAFMDEELKIPHEQVAEAKIDRCHRLGKVIGNKTRPIIVRFTQYEVKRTIFSKVKNLHGKHFSVQQQYPPAIMEKRSELLKVLKAEKGKGHNCKLVDDRLYINGQLYI